MSSVGWLIIIIIGVTAAAVGNIYYPLARRLEEKQEAALAVRETLTSELQSNLVIAKRMKAHLVATPPSISPFDKLDTGAWSAVSNGQLLMSLDGEIRQKYLNIYSSINKANEYHAKIMDYRFGMPSALSSAPEAKERLFKKLPIIIDEIEGLIESLPKTAK